MELKIARELFDEKVYGGFEASDPDDETFLLNKLGKYPGKLPYELEEKESETPFLEHLVSTEANKTTEEIAPQPQMEEATEEPSAKEPFELEEGFEQRKEPEIQKPVDQNSFEKETHEPIPYEKSGIEKESREPIPYKKAGLLEDEEPIPFERSRNLVKEAKAVEAEEKAAPKSIWDIFQEGEQIPSQEPTTAEPTEELTDANQVEAVEQTQVNNTEKEQTQEPKTQTILIDSDSIVDIPFEIKIEEISQEELSKVFDDDFRKTLLEDLEKSQRRREAKKKVEKELISQQEKEELQKELNQFEDVKTSVAEEVEIDLSSIEIEKPSQIIAKDLVETEEIKKPKKRKKEKKPKTEESKTQETIVQEAESQQSVVEFEKEEPKELEEEQISEEKVEKEEKEKKKRKVPVLWIAVASGLVLILFVIGGYLLYHNLFVPQEKPKEIAKKEPPAKKLTPEKPIEEKIEQPQSTEKDKQRALAVETKPEEKIEKHAPSIEEKPSEPKVEVKKEPEKQIDLAKPTEKKEPAKTKIEKEEKPIIARKENEPTTKLTQRQLKIPKEVKIVETIQEEYSIEILSTADPEEAGYWLNLLQQRGINAYQKVHRLRNVPYYKIRIGNFKTIEEAKTVARALGFKNVWIDRIK